MTDTNQASELFELCKEVYERTGLGHPITDFERGIVIHWEDGQMFDFPTDELDIEEYIAPLYTSDYLLEKLPHKITNRVGHYLEVCPVTPNGFKWWRASYTYEPFAQYADTPLKALLKLTIALSEAGELNG